MGDKKRDNVQRKEGARGGIDRQTAGANKAVSSRDSFSLFLTSPALAPPKQVKERDSCAMGTSSMEGGDEGRDAEWLLPWENFKITISGCRCRKMPCLGRYCSPTSVFIYIFSLLSHSSYVLKGQVCQSCLWQELVYTGPGIRSQIINLFESWLSLCLDRKVNLTLSAASYSFIAKILVVNDVFQTDKCGISCAASYFVCLGRSCFSFMKQSVWGKAQK